LPGRRSRSDRLGDRTNPTRRYRGACEVIINMGIVGFSVYDIESVKAIDNRCSHFVLVVCQSYAEVKRMDFEQYKLD